MLERIIGIGGAVVITLIAGSIKNAPIIFIGASLITMGFWFLLGRIFHGKRS